MDILLLVGVFVTTDPVPDNNQALYSDLRKQERYTFLYINLFHIQLENEIMLTVYTIH